MQTNLSSLPSSGASSLKLAAGNNPVLNKCGPTKSVKIEAPTYTEAERHPPAQEGSGKSELSEIIFEDHTRSPSQTTIQKEDKSRDEVIPKRKITFPPKKKSEKAEQDDRRRLAEKNKHSQMKNNRSKGGQNPGWSVVSAQCNTPLTRIQEEEARADCTPPPPPPKETTESIVTNGREKTKCAVAWKLVNDEKDALMSELDNPELHRSVHTRFEYVVRRWEEGKFFSWTVDRTFMVYVADVPYLEKNMPKNYSMQALTEWRRKVTQHYHRELAELLLGNPAHWLERKQGLENWAFHHIEENVDNIAGVNYANSEDLERLRQGGRDLEKSRVAPLWTCSRTQLRKLLPLICWSIGLTIMCLFFLYCLSSVHLIMGGFAAYVPHASATDPSVPPPSFSNALTLVHKPESMTWLAGIKWLYNTYLEPVLSLLAAVVHRIMYDDTLKIDWVVFARFILLLLSVLYLVAKLVLYLFSALWLFCKLFCYRLRHVSGRRVRWRYFSLVYRCPILMARIEEYAKRIWFVAEFIGYIESYWHESMVPYHFHVRTSKMPLDQAIEFHERFNREQMTNSGSMHDAYVQLTRGEITPSEFHDIIFSEHEGRVQYRMLSNKPAVLQPIAPPRVNIASHGFAVPIVPYQLGIPPPQPETSCDVFGEMMAIVPAGKPGRTYLNKLGAYNYRLADEWNRPYTPLDRKRQIRDHAHKVFAGFDDFLRPMSEEQWEMGLAPKHRRRLENARRLDQLGIFEGESTIFIKTDELLSFKEKEGQTFFVPRAIINISDQLWRATALETKRVQNALKEMFSPDGEIRVIHGKTMRASLSYRGLYACGTTTTDLNKFWGEALKENCDRFSMMFNGDDTAFVLTIDGWKIIGEIDYTAYDGSQHSGHLNVGKDLIAIANKDASEVYKEMYKQPWIFRCGEYTKEIFPTSPDWFQYNMRATGENGTGPLNSAANINACLMVFRILRNAYFDERFDGFTTREEAFATVFTPSRVLREFVRLGLTAKLKMSVGLDEWPDVSFLKHCAVRDVQGNPAWIPMPSRIVKLGKFMTNPRLIDRRHISGDLKAAQAIYGQWISFGPLHTINTGFARLQDHLHGLALGQATPTELEDWRIQHTQFPEISWMEFARFLQQRYQIDYDDWISCIRTMTSITSFPCDWAHPVAWRLFEIDYG